MANGIGNSSSFLYPSVTSIPGQGGVQGPEKNIKKNPEAAGEFDKVLSDQIKQPLKFSAHANQRLTDRKINLGPELLARVNDAIDKAAAKGVEDTLVLTSDAALIVNVPNRTVITAMDRNAMAGNVFTNIDGAVIV
jgi:flagellar operon protein